MASAGSYFSLSVTRSSLDVCTQGKVSGRPETTLGKSLNSIPLSHSWNVSKVQRLTRQILPCKR